MKRIYTTIALLTVLVLGTGLQSKAQDEETSLPPAKNNLSIYAFQLFQKTLAFGYERALSDNFGAKLSYFSNLDVNFQEVELHGRYYFLRTAPADLELSFLTLDDLSYDVFGYASAKSLFDFHNTNLIYTGRLGIGGHVICLNGFNIESYLGCGYYTVQKGDYIENNKKSELRGINVSMRIAAAYRF
ncbi:MAG: hypothetical protein MRY83_06750 [Flavobacteriales bacterium]|nr:hypothetical protein [Flavobacteriales bacterium]